ncbi:hypothetical protein LOZ65_002717 [Ophidiomyces ophidiicola]|nr:hypothetical protein LOZ65_002717 [Ophidiomyces ophidiicola]
MPNDVNLGGCGALPLIWGLKPSVEHKSTPYSNMTYEEKLDKVELMSCKGNKWSISDTATAAPTITHPFSPSKSLFLDAHGIRLIRLPLPSSELEIPIRNADGSLAYTSKRSKRSSGDATLSSPEIGELLSTSYFFGPNRDPVIQPASKGLQAGGAPENSPLTIRVTSEWKSRTQYFTTIYGDSFQWRYIRCDDPRWVCKKLLVLEKVKNSVASRRIAQLVRNEVTRPEGTSKCTAGNGGELMLDGEAMGAEIDEALVVATCLLMLKKEVDRRRMMQMMVVCGMFSGGS